MKLRKDRDARLYKFWLEHQGWSLQSIANVFHIKHRQQAFEIIKREKQIVHQLIKRDIEGGD